MPTQPPPADKRFKRGESGNPAGRPSSLVKVSKVRDMMLKHLPDIVDSVCKQAMAGDPAAARLVVERLIPALRPVELPIKVTLPEGAGLAERGRAIIDAAARAEVTPTQASILVGALASLGRVVEVEELVARVEALEKGRTHEQPADPD